MSSKKRRRLAKGKKCTKAVMAYNAERLLPKTKPLRKIVKKSPAPPVFDWQKEQ